MSNVPELRRNEFAAHFMGDMKHPHVVKAAGLWDSAGAIDEVLLDAHERYRRRAVLTGERGTTFLLNLPRAMALRTCAGEISTPRASTRLCSINQASNSPSPQPRSRTRLPG